MIPKTPRRIRIKVEPSKDGQFFYKLVAGNGETVATSETYTRRGDAVRAAIRFRRLVALAELS